MKQEADQKAKIHALEEELKKIKEEKDKHQKQSDERLKIVEKMEGDMKDASNAILKLEEARIVLNRLLGPGGAYTEKERDKYLKNAQGAGLPEAQIGP